MRFSTACPDWERRIVAGESLIPMEPLFPEEAEAALDVFKSLQVCDLPQIFDKKTGVYRHPTFGEVCEQFVFDFVAAVFGAYDPGSAHRLIEEFFLLISKKNGKSTIVAGIMVTALIRNWRPHQELSVIAPTREVAENSFGPAAAMIRADPELSILLHIQDNVKTITHTVTKAFLKIVSADSATSAGKKSAFVLIDELWLFGKKAGAAAMLQEATGGLISRPEGFVIYISTQSDEGPTGVFKQKLDYFRDVRDGKINDPQSLAVLYEFPESMLANDTYLDPENWHITNPNMGRSVRRDWMERKLMAVRAGEDEEGDTLQSFLAKHLNVEIGMRLRANRWGGANHWIDAVDPELASFVDPFDALHRMLERIDVAVVSADGGGKDDLFGLTVVGREPEEVEIKIKVGGRERSVFTKRWLSWSHAWCFRDVLQLRKKIAPKLLDFEKAGHLTIIDTALEDIAAIVDIIQMIKDLDLLACVAVDPAVIGDLVDALAAPEINITEENGMLVGVSQGYALMNAIKTTERRLSNGTFRHAGGPMMSWCVSNLKIEPTATAIRATKQTAGDAKIDPVMALFDAVTMMIKNPEPKKIGSVYEKRGLRVA